MRPWLALLLVGCGSVRQVGAASAPAAVHAEEEGGAKLHLDAPRGVSLLVTHGDDERARVLCTSSCDVTTEFPNSVFRAAVTDLPDSPAFSLPPGTKRARIGVETAPKVLPGLGAVVGTVGGAAMLVGGVVSIGDAAGVDDLSGTAVGGLITVAAGSAVLAAGLVLAGLSGTHVEVRRTASGAAIAF